MTSISVVLAFLALVDAAPPHFEQPTSNQESGTQLKNKCYVYSTLNAIKETGISDILNDWNQQNADDFVTSMGNSMGGGPGVVLTKLKDTQNLADNFQVITVEPKSSSYTDVKGALTNGYAAVIIGAKSGSSAHWLYATSPPSTTAGQILAYDQQLKVYVNISSD